MDHEAILTRLEQARPDVLLVAMGHPKQERWLAMHRDRLNIPLCMGVGGSLDLLGGVTRRAPVWMQTAGCEWLYRVFQEPERLGKRYLNDACGLLRHLPKQLAATVIQPHRFADSAVKAAEVCNTSVIEISGDLSGVSLTQLEEHLLYAQEQDRHIILDLSKTAYLGPDSLGSLLHLTRVMKDRQRHLWFVGVPSHLLRVMRAAKVRHYFATASSVSDAIYRIRKQEADLPSELVASGDIGHPARHVHFRVEMLRDLCERILSVGQTTEFSFGGLNARTP